MFTGIVETIGTVESTNRVGGDIRLVISSSHFKDAIIGLGDSVACNGACLTVIERSEGKLSFDVSVESLDHTLIGQWSSGSKVNLELALLPTTRLGGHLVSGHVDGVAELVKITEDARSKRMIFKLPNELTKYVAKKGSITINGVSLTVNSVDKDCFDVNVIPHTFEITTLGELKAGSKAHIEVDLIARYLERMLNGASDSGNDADKEMLNTTFLSEHGFMK